MTTPTMSDAAYYTPQMRTGFSAVAGYWGGPDAAHTWSAQDWEACQSPGLGRLPIWVPSPSASQAEAAADIDTIVNIILNWRVPKGLTIAFDLETSKADLAYMTQISGDLQWLGYGCMAYGSLSTITQAAPAYLWKWDADWTNIPHLTPGMAATQWTNGTAFDQSVISEELAETLNWR
jgi:hypothetical protein